MSTETNRRQFLASALLSGVALAARPAIAGESAMDCSAALDGETNAAETALRLVRRYSPSAQLVNSPALQVSAAAAGDAVNAEPIRIHAPVTEPTELVRVLGNVREHGFGAVRVQGNVATFAFRASKATVEVQHEWHG